MTGNPVDAPKQGRNRVRQVGWLVAMVGVVGFAVASQLVDGTLYQQGDFDLSPDQGLHQINYPIPYTIPPHIESFECTCNYAGLEIGRFGFNFTVRSWTNEIKGQWVTSGIVDESLDARPILQRLSWPERLFAGVGLIGSIASIWSLIESKRSQINRTSNEVAHTYRDSGSDAKPKSPIFGDNSALKKEIKGLLRARGELDLNDLVRGTSARGAHDGQQRVLRALAELDEDIESTGGVMPRLRLRRA